MTLSLHDIIGTCPELLQHCGGNVRVCTIWSREGKLVAWAAECDRCGRKEQSKTEPDKE